ncbi:MAG TPA: deoxyribodipyrimidine photo-lyase [bacterium]|nr:deoxyribodipyrimidine photo-lyase [bacterium]
MIEKERIKVLKEAAISDRNFVLYWMQQSQRAEFNHALEYAIQQANQLKKPLIAFLGLTDDFPEANERHYYFMLEGLKETQAALKKRNIKMVIQHISPESGLLKLAKQAALVVTDRGYLKIQRQWRKTVADKIDCKLVQIESDVIVPVEEASPKEEYAAATFRPKISKKLDQYLVPLSETAPEKSSLNISLDSLDISNTAEVIASLKIDKAVSKVDGYHGGTSQAKKQLQHFIENKLTDYPDLRNDPTKDYLSNMSPYLHFGQISPLYIALKAMAEKNPGNEAFLEELIVRRELSMNYCFYNQNYDQLESLPQWALTTLRDHEIDKREYNYSTEQFEQAETHDPYWNAAQKEMVLTGKMHGYMRMYWGKKILEWTETPKQAFEIALYLNNKYELDGRDPNGFTGVAWCFGKHDRGWAERPVFGKVRYMNANGLKRKFDAEGYVEKVGRLKNNSD